MRESSGMDYPVLISKILLYPIKALDPVEVQGAELVKGGALKFDRAWALVDEKGRLVNGKRCPKVCGVRATYDLFNLTVRVARGESDRYETFELQGRLKPLEEWLSDALDEQVRLRYRMEGGWPDDEVAAGPTVISTSTLEAVASWFPTVTSAEIRRRFRTNIELDAREPFWEDRLFGDEGQAVSFKLGSAAFLGINPCQRCVVPTRDSHSAKPLPEFQQIFSKQREAGLPTWAQRARFNHFYRLAVNTVASDDQRGQKISVGDPIRIT